MNSYSFIIKEENAGMRIDKFISSGIGLSRNSVVSHINDGNVFVNGSKVKKKYIIAAGDNVEIVIPPLKDIEVCAQDIPIDIFYEDSDICIVNKAKGMVVHPAAGNYDNTLVNALLYHCKDNLSGINGYIRPGIVHRIDKDTSGLLIVAKNDTAHVRLSEQISKHSFTREYQAVVCGNISENGVIDAPIGRHHIDRKKMCVTDKNSKTAVTHYEVIENFNKYCHIKLRLETGRTHQIRVHMAYIGHPVAGDTVYGNGKPTWLYGQCLHAKKIGFIHPSTNKYIEFESDLPEYFKKFIKSI